MINRIDVGTVLKHSVCDLYSNLVTRPTGAAVRIGIEHQLDEIGERALAVLDFSHVGLLDFSCADEIVAKLLLQYVSVDIPRREVYFIFYGMNDSHVDAVETVLSRHGLALVTQRQDGDAHVIGQIDADARRIWELVWMLGTARIPEVARESGLPLDRAEVALDDLWRRRLIIRQGSGYVSLGGPGLPRTTGGDFPPGGRPPASGLEA